MHRWKPRFERLLILLEVARGKLYETGSLDSGKKRNGPRFISFRSGFWLRRRISASRNQAARAPMSSPACWPGVLQFMLTIARLSMDAKPIHAA
jgi:hypothetical protein